MILVRLNWYTYIIFGFYIIWEHVKPALMFVEGKRIKFSHLIRIKSTSILIGSYGSRSKN